MSTIASWDKYYTARIIERRDRSEGLWLIRVGPGEPYTTLSVDHPEKRIERAYSIVSAPCEEGPEFFTELGPRAELTPHLDKLQSGDTTLCRKVAKGRFTLDIKSGRTEHLLLAPVTRIAPVVSYGAQHTRIGKAGAVSCQATISSSVCKEEVAPGNSDIAKSWSAVLTKCSGSSSPRRSVGRGKALLGRARPAASTIWSESTPIWGDGDRRLQPRTFGGIPAGAKTGKASCSAPVG